MKLTVKIQKLDSPTKETCKKPLLNNQRVNIFIEAQPPRLSRTSSSSPVKLTAYQFKHKPHPAPLGKSVQIKNYKFTTYSRDEPSRIDSQFRRSVSFVFSVPSALGISPGRLVEVREEERGQAKRDHTCSRRESLCLFLLLNQGNANRRKQP